MHTFFLLLFLIHLFFVIKGPAPVKIVFFTSAMTTVSGIVTIITNPITVGFSFGILLFSSAYFFCKKAYRRELINIPLPFRKAIIFYIICCFFVALFDYEQPIFQSIKLFILDFFGSIAWLLLGFIIIKRREDFNKSITLVILLFIGITIYGLFNYITQTNPYHEAVVNLYMSKSEQSIIDLQLRTLEGWGDRYRANSTCSSPFYFGFLSNIVGLLSIYAMAGKIVNKYIAISGLIASMLIAVICGSRAVLFGYLISIFSFIMIQGQAKQVVKYIFYFLTLIIICYFTVPFVTTNIDNLINLITGSKQTVGGSSFKMRILQLISAIQLWLEHPIWGHGFEATKRFQESVHKSVLLSNMAGYESLIYQYLINRGIVVVITYVIFLKRYFKSLVIYEYKSTLLKSLGMSIMIGFLIFAISTGPLSSFAITYFFCGMVLKVLIIEYHEIKESNEQIISHRYTRL